MTSRAAETAKLLTSFRVGDRVRLRPHYYSRLPASNTKLGKVTAVHDDDDRTLVSVTWGMGYGHYYPADLEHFDG